MTVSRRYRQTCSDSLQIWTRPLFGSAGSGLRSTGRRGSESAGKWKRCGRHSRHHDQASSDSMGSTNVTGGWIAMKKKKKRVAGNAFVADLIDGLRNAEYVSEKM